MSEKVLDYMNSSLELHDEEKRRYVQVQSNQSSIKLVSFTLINKKNGLNLAVINEDIDPDEDTPFVHDSFSIDKFQVGCLIDYLKRCYDSMD